MTTNGPVKVRARPLRHTFVPIRRSMVGTPAARAEFARAVSALVATLSSAHARASAGDDARRLQELLGRAREQLDAADEKLLMLDRRRERSIFRRAERLRSHLDVLHDRFG